MTLRRTLLQQLLAVALLGYTLTAVYLLAAQLLYQLHAEDRNRERGRRTPVAAQLSAERTPTEPVGLAASDSPPLQTSSSPIAVPLALSGAPKATRNQTPSMQPVLSGLSPTRGDSAASPSTPKPTHDGGRLLRRPPPPIEGSSSSADVRLPTSFCIRSGSAPASTASAEGLPSDAYFPSLAAAKAACVSNRRCGGFSLTTAALPDRPRPVRFFADTTLTCDVDSVAFVRSEACAAVAPFGVSLVTQLSLERLWMLSEQARRWPAHIVAAMWLRADQPEPQLAPQLRERVRIAALRTPSQSQYPINALRNAAIRAVVTSHFFVCDVDLWPSAELYAELLALDVAFWSTPRVAIVVAAFTLDPRAMEGARPQGSALPSSQQQLEQCVRMNACTAFKGAPDFVPGQQLSTDYVRWWASSAHALPYRIPCFDKVSYEPYVVVASGNRSRADGGSGAPAFDEEYTGYGKNKVQWVQTLRSEGYSFWVLPRGFLIHCPHGMSESGRRWQRNAGNHKAKMDRLFEFQLAVQQAQEREDALTPGAEWRCPTRTPACAKPLVQQTSMLRASGLGIRVSTEVLG